MLGDLIGEMSGKVTSVRVVRSDRPFPKLEILYQGGGKLLGQDVAEFATYRNQLEPDGVFFGDADGVVFTTDVQGAAYHGEGVGKLLGRGGAASWRGTLMFESFAPVFQPLNDIAVAFEFEIDETGLSQTTKLYEWK